MEQKRETKTVTEVKMSQRELARIVADRLEIPYHGAVVSGEAFTRITFTMTDEENVLDTVAKQMEIMTK